MPKMIFVNLPVSDLKRSTAFYEAIGGVKNAHFSNDKASMMVFSDTISVMLLTHDFFGTFAVKPIADAKASTEVLLCLSEDSREDVDARIAAAGAAGGATDVNAADDYGYMYGRSFEDPDGHTFQVMWMDMEAAKAAMEKAA